MLANQGLVIFLIKGSCISYYCLNSALTDFLEQYKEEFILLREKDYEEVDRIRQNQFLLTESHLFKKIEPFLLPFYEK